ncbi:gluconate 2-dehydrogenase subunit 3 family protein [Chitinasiproducens palmae]|uniref:Gluconate 2-dehydrogenase gamma chain n=1 Tax=Chitinasiproducens palmae TaxID=1770053 RepID=A0A1H2PTG5_9BURK|nr:gluconate 2-dehydrogenase subunit 3 family protein [Chitinasiproducens palmae]SDV50384.1 gluconate 2-dehydrogenase gamma chain [Chitinasiproducens palmae]
MKKIGISPSRRLFLRQALGAAPAAVVAGSGAIGLQAAAAADAGKTYTPRYFTGDEWTLLNALVDRLIPPDDVGPGAVEAGVPEFIDRQMDTPYGHGALWYMHGPFDESASDLFGYQLSLSPRDLYRNALPGLADAVRKQYNKAYHDLDAAQKDEVLHQLEQGKFAIGRVPAGAFFGQLLQNTREGYFCDPVHGGNKAMAAWKMIGFPGARGDYLDWVEQYGRNYPLGPVSLG